MFAAKTFSGKNVAVFGLARSGLACLEALKKGGAHVYPWDDSQKSRKNAYAKGIDLVDLTLRDFKDFDALVLSPGVPLTHPEPHWTVKKANEAGVEIIGDTEVFVREVEGSGAKVIAITGTNGKSTTTALIGHLLSNAGLDAHVGGNIGEAVFLLPQPIADRVYVLELSSYQIDLTPSLKADAALLLNLTPDHLDRHGNMENYAAVKARIFSGQDDSCAAIICTDDEYTRDIAEKLDTGAWLIQVSTKTKVDHGVCVLDGVLNYRLGGLDVAHVDLNGLQGLRGEHNWQNAGAAFAAALYLNLSVTEIENGMQTFAGLAHRMQQVGVLDGMTFINDSKATNADAAAHALSSFENIIWIAGGLAKDGGIESLKPLFGRITHACLIGKAADDFAVTLNQSDVSNQTSGTIEQAVTDAVSYVQTRKLKNAVILLAPACASFDQYDNFELRGEAFSEAISSYVDQNSATEEREAYAH